MTTLDHTSNMLKLLTISSSSFSRSRSHSMSTRQITSALRGLRDELSLQTSSSPPEECLAACRDTSTEGSDPDLLDADIVCRFLGLEITPLTPAVDGREYDVEAGDLSGTVVIAGELRAFPEFLGRTVFPEPGLLEDVSFLRFRLEVDAEAPSSPT